MTENGFCVIYALAYAPGRFEAAPGEFIDTRQANPASLEACEGIRRVGARLGEVPPATGECAGRR